MRTRLYRPMPYFPAEVNFFIIIHFQLWPIYAKVLVVFPPERFLRHTHTYTPLCIITNQVPSPLSPAAINFVILIANYGQFLPRFYGISTGSILEAHTHIYTHPSMPYYFSTPPFPMAVDFCIINANYGQFPLRF